MHSRYLCYTGPVEQLERRLHAARLRGELDRQMCRVHDSLMRHHDRRGRLEGWAAIAAAVTLEAGFRIGRRRLHFGPRSRTRRIVESEPRQ